MILAAGLGTRLGPMTRDRPKALVEIGGRTLVDITLSRLKAFGVGEVIINVHHFADSIVEYLETHNFGMRIEVSREDLLLETGGGLKQAAHFFLEGPDGPDEPFIVHNVDVLSAIDLGRMVQFHRHSRALATLATQQRVTSRPLLFDERLELCGRRWPREQTTELVRPAPHAQELAFCGIHVISPRLLPMMTEAGAFSIIPVYLRLAALGERILAFRADEYYWLDVGRPENVARAAEDIERNVV